jgi:hypothetical protein
MLMPSKWLWTCPTIVSGGLTPSASRIVGTRSIAWWNCSRIVSISLNASANHRIGVVLPWERGDVISPHRSCDSGRCRKSAAFVDELNSGCQRQTTGDDCVAIVADGEPVGSVIDHVSAHRPCSSETFACTPDRRPVAAAPCPAFVRCRAPCPRLAVIDGRPARTQSGDWFALMDTVGHHGEDLSSVVPTGFRSADHTEASALVDVSPDLGEQLRCDCPSESAVSA